MFLLQKTFGNVNEWFDNIDRYGSDNVQKLLIGNKCDLVKEKRVDSSTAKVRI